MRQFFARLKFWLQVQSGTAPFWIRRKTGHCVAVQSYNPFTDMVSIREGRFGTYDFGAPYPQIEREGYLAFKKRDGWERYPT